jgi:YidC/Oxa1 family membrane protein insertase
MEKRTVLAIVLSVLVFAGFYLVQYYLFPPSPQGTEAAPVEKPDQPAVQPAAPVSPVAVPAAGAVSTDTIETDTGIEAGAAVSTVPAEELITIETDLLEAVLTNTGGDIVSCRLKQHNDKGELVEMVLSGENEAHAFTVAFGGRGAAPLTARFRVNRPSPLVVEFAGDFALQDGGTFTLTKRYEFRPGEYMFALTVTLDRPLDIGGAAYTLGFGPQIGPRFEKLDNRYEYRHFYAFNGKRRQLKAGETVDSRFTWAGIAGKYFAAIVIPDNNLYELAFSSDAEPGLNGASRFFMTRPAGVGSDLYHFYLGPKNQENLGRYDTGNNGFKLRDLQLIKAANTSGFLSPLENLLKFGLRFFYGLVSNYGVAIILLTLLVKIILFPLTKKSSEASIMMQVIAPKIKELREKYRDNPAKLNAEMATLYKKEGHNPMSGCLPLLIQLPLLWAMYNLFNTHFDLRGAMFIPGWIPDLSLPESIWTFSGSLPVLGWNSLRLLPFIYMGSQLLYGLATKTPEQQGNPSMAMMYAMPIIFFFILYDVPSGLLVFWIFSNVFTLVQQIVLNKYLARKRAAAPEQSEPVIAPKRKKKR